MWQISYLFKVVKGSCQLEEEKNEVKTNNVFWEDSTAISSILIFDNSETFIQMLTRCTGSYGRYVLCL